MLLIFIAISLLAALFCGLSYSIAESGNPFKTEDGFLANHPYKLAAFACVCPLFKASIRSNILKAEKQQGMATAAQS
jgi:hypothetical protein